MSQVPDQQQKQKQQTIPHHRAIMRCAMMYLCDVFASYLCDVFALNHQASSFSPFSLQNRNRSVRRLASPSILLCQKIQKNKLQAGWLLFVCQPPACSFGPELFLFSCSGSQKIPGQPDFPVAGLISHSSFSTLSSTSTSTSIGVNWRWLSFSSLGHLTRALSSESPVSGISR